MNETPQQYIKRILGHIEGKDALKIQAATPKKLAALIKNVPPSKLRKRPAPDKWSVTEILAHLGDAEIVTAWRIRSILGAPGTPIQAYDQNAWVAAGRYSERNPRQCLEVFRAVREANLTVLKSLTTSTTSNKSSKSSKRKSRPDRSARCAMATVAAKSRAFVRAQDSCAPTRQELCLRAITSVALLHLCYSAAEVPGGSHVRYSRLCPRNATI
jgi:hypothetical protein